MAARKMPGKLLFVFIYCVCLSNFSHADYDPSSLKTLFTDKSQRDQIDAARSGVVTGEEKKSVNQVNLSGYVTRSDGKSVVWLNNKNTLDSSTIGEIRVHESTIGSNKKVTLSVDDKKIELKPGELWDTATGKIAGD